MFSTSGAVDSTPSARPRRFDFRLAAAVLLLGAAIPCTYWTIEGLSTRRMLRMELAEISHVRYGLLSVDRWVEKIVPILEARIDALDLKTAGGTSLKPTIEKSLYRLLDDVKEKMSAKPAAGAAGGGLMGQGNALMANLMIGALKPHVPEYADVVLAEIGKPESRKAFKNFLKGILAGSAKDTFGKVDTTWYSYILKRFECTDAAACQAVIGTKVQEADAKILQYSATALIASALAFALLMIGRPVLGRLSIAVLLLFCLVLLAGGVLTPMIEVEAKITRLDLTFLGTPISFTDQVLYFQSKGVLEVFRTLIDTGKPDMWIVGVLVLLFSIVFPTLKTCTLALCMYRPSLLQGNRMVRFLALESSKWSMADVMALAIFMSFVAFNGLIANTMGGLREVGASLAIPTESSKLLPGYHLFIGFCLASLLLSKKLERGIRVEPGNTK